MAEAMIKKVVFIVNSLIVLEWWMLPSSLKGDKFKVGSCGSAFPTPVVLTS